MSVLRAVNEIDSPYCQVFYNFENFNWIQSAVFDDIFKTSKSMLISAPTGAGKTVICELAILNLLMQLKETNNDPKIIYVAPVKALCSEKFNDWNQKFRQLNLKCLELTGDSDIIDFNDVLSANIIVTTPEKWDSITRRWREYQEFVRKIRLFLIDEVHLLNEDVRGPILETIVSRMKTVNTSLESRWEHKLDSAFSLRFIAVSATIPNIEDLRTWLGGYGNCIQHKFSDDQRPVKLEKFILGYPTNLPTFRFDIHLNYRLSEVIRQYSNQKPTLIFCSSRKSVEMASAVLQKQYSFKLSESQQSALIALSSKLQNAKLIKLVMQGIAFHHAGLTYPDRNQIEEAFRCGHIMVLISTNTLALGVNLPAHLVIIKSTETFIRGAVIEYTESQILQMIGRAGRPQYDTTGIAVIMTQKKNEKKYENLMNGCTPVESHLHKHLAEHLNSEIVLQTITDLEIAMEWIRSTFLYVRAVRCPINYGFEKFMTRDKVEKKLEEICLTQINSLEEYGLVEKDQTSQMTVHATPFGRLMSRYYISFDTMKMFRKIRGNESFLEIFNTITRCKEFSEFTLRVNEKKALNEINNFPVRFPIQGKIKTREDKISCLIQGIFGNLHITDSYLVQESLKMMRLGERISKCFLEYVRLLQTKEIPVGLFKAQLNAVILSKCFRSKLWEQSIYIAKQLKKIGEAYSKLLVNAGKTTIQSILDTNPRILERILNKQPPFGDEIIESLRLFPAYNIEMNLIDENSVQILIYQINSNHVYDGNNSIIIVGDDENNLLLYYDKVDSTIQETGVFTRTLSLCGKNKSAIYAHLVHEVLVGVDKSHTLVLKPMKEVVLEKKSTKPKKKQSNNTEEVQKINATTTNLGEPQEKIEKNVRSKLKSFELSKKKVGITSKRLSEEKSQTSKSHNSSQMITDLNWLDTSNTIALVNTDETVPLAEGNISSSETRICNQLLSQFVNKELISEMVEIDELLMEDEAEKQALEQDPYLYETENYISDPVWNDHDMSIIDVNEIPVQSSDITDITEINKEDPKVVLKNLESLVKTKVFRQQTLNQFYKITKKPINLLRANDCGQNPFPKFETVTFSEITSKKSLEHMQPEDVHVEKFASQPLLNTTKTLQKQMTDCDKVSKLHSPKSTIVNINTEVHNQSAAVFVSPLQSRTKSPINLATNPRLLPRSLLLRETDPPQAMVKQSSENGFLQDSTPDLSSSGTDKVKTNPVDLTKNQLIANQISINQLKSNSTIDDTDVNFKSLKVLEKNFKRNILKENLFKPRKQMLNMTTCDFSTFIQSDEPLNLSKTNLDNFQDSNKNYLGGCQPEIVEPIRAINLCKKDSNKLDPITTNSENIATNLQTKEIHSGEVLGVKDHPSDLINLQIKLLIETAKTYKSSPEVDNKVTKILEILQGTQNITSMTKVTNEDSNTMRSNHPFYALPSPPLCLSKTKPEVLDLSDPKSMILKRQLIENIHPSPTKRARLNIIAANNSYRLRLAKSSDSNLSPVSSKVLTEAQQINSQLMTEVLQMKCFGYKDTNFLEDNTTSNNTCTNFSDFFDEPLDTSDFFGESSKLETLDFEMQSSNGTSKLNSFNIKPDPDLHESGFYSQGAFAKEEHVKEEFSNIFSQNLSSLDKIFGISSSY